MLDQFRRQGNFITSFTLLGVEYTFEAYSKLNVNERSQKRSEALHTAALHNQKITAEEEEIAKPIKQKYQLLLEILRTKPRYRGQADDLRSLASEGLNAVATALEPYRAEHPRFDMATVRDVMCVWEYKVEPPHEKLARLLANHNWYYSFEDDHSRWSAGEYQHREILAMVQKLGPEAQAAYNRACPWLNEDGSLNGKNPHNP